MLIICILNKINKMQVMLNIYKYVSVTFISRGNDLLFYTYIYFNEIYTNLYIYIYKVIIILYIISHRRIRKCSALHTTYKF